MSKPSIGHPTTGFSGWLWRQWLRPCKPGQVPGRLEAVCSKTFIAIGILIFGVFVANCHLYFVVRKAAPPSRIAVALGSNLLNMLCMAFPAWFHHRRSMVLRRLASGSCIYCGYDLRASPGDCPECGKPKYSAAEQAKAKHASPLP
ncbi:MAG: hypothetical protein NTW19_13750 [Planctomycetota bacterium]|nr:hypothetical protein [Planctomycetota bacterium]